MSGNKFYDVTITDHGRYRVRVVAGYPDEAERIAYFLSKANLTGHDSHGVIRVPRYVEWLGTGRVRAGQHVETLVDTPAITLLDGKHGFGQTVGPEACRIGIDKALANGVAVVALRNAGHLGRIGDFAESAVEAGLVSIHFVNVHSSLLVAPFGGADRRTSTNPIAIGVPTSDGKPFILDFATSMSASVTALANVGPGIGSVIGPAGNFAGMPEVVKWLLAFEMILGRLELLGGILILTPDFWRD